MTSKALLAATALVAIVFSLPATMLDIARCAGPCRAGVLKP